MKKKKPKSKKPGGSSFVRHLREKRTHKALDIPRALKLGMEYHRAGRLVQAEHVYRDILSVDPQNFTCISQLALVMQQLGNINEEITLLKKALSLRPDFIDGHIHLANSLLQCNDPDGAAACYKNALSLNPDLAPVHNNLGNILKDKGDLDGAIASYRKAISILPDFAEAHYGLGKVLHLNDEPKAAIISYKKALSIKPDLAIAYNNLGNVYEDLGEIENAIRWYREAVSIESDYAEAYYNLGLCYYVQGDLEAAKKYCRKSISIKPDLTEAHRILSRMIKYSTPDAHIHEMEKLIAQENIPDDKAMHLSFALGKAYEDCGDYEKSFSFVRRGNRLKRKTYEYSTDVSRKLFAQIKGVNNIMPVSLLRQNFQTDPLPIFILGMPRSGTSLVEQILASHQDVHGAGELRDFQKIFLRITHSSFLEKAYESLPGNSEEILARIRSEYSKVLRNHAETKKFVTDKMPYNFLSVGIIRYAFPEAKIIQCRRNCMDNCFSIFKNYFEGDHLYAYEMKELGEYYLLYQDLMDYWHHAFPGTIHTIDYENIVANPEEEIRSLLDYCNLPWQEKCLLFHQTERTVATASAVQVRKPIYTSSVHFWKKYENHLKDLSTVLSEKNTI